MLKPAAQCDSIWKWDVQEGIRSWRESPHQWDSCPRFKRCFRPSSDWKCGTKLGVRHYLDTESGIPTCLTYRVTRLCSVLVNHSPFLNNATSSCTSMTQNILMVPWMISACYDILDGWLTDWWTDGQRNHILAIHINPACFHWPASLCFLPEGWPRILMRVFRLYCFSGWSHFSLAVCLWTLCGTVNRFYRDRKRTWDMCYICQLSCCFTLYFLLKSMRGKYQLHRTLPKYIHGAVWNTHSVMSLDIT